MRNRPGRRRESPGGGYGVDCLRICDLARIGSRLDVYLHKRPPHEKKGLGHPNETLARRHRLSAGAFSGTLYFPSNSLARPRSRSPSSQCALKLPRTGSTEISIVRVGSLSQSPLQRTTIPQRQPTERSCALCAEVLYFHPDLRRSQHVLFGVPRLILLAIDGRL